MDPTPKQLPSLEYLNECFECDPQKGGLVWKARPVHHFKDERSQRLQNAQRAGRIAGTGKTYLRTKVTTGNFLNHRIIFYMSHGFIPQEIDHIDGNKKNNSIDNLRPATRSQNMHNKAAPRNSRSGVKGVHFHKDTNKWVATCTFNKKSNHLGLFKSVEEAAQAVISFRRTILGEFSNRDTPLYTRRES